MICQLGARLWLSAGGRAAEGSGKDQSYELAVGAPQPKCQPASNPEHQSSTNYEYTELRWRRTSLRHKRHLLISKYHSADATGGLVPVKVQKS